MYEVASGLKHFTVPSGFRLASGDTLHPDAFLAYETFGHLDDNASNAILWPTCYGQRSKQQGPLIGKGKRFDSSKYFIVAVNMLGNGVSYSPTIADIGSDYPRAPVTYFDNAALQEQLMHHLGIQQWALIYGFSMGCMCALQWAVQFPSKVSSVVAVCGSARCNPANAYFLKTLQQALAADPHCKCDEDGRVVGFLEKPTQGLRDFALTYADWIFDAPSTKAVASPDSNRPDYARSKLGGRAYADELYKQMIPSDSEEAFLEAWVGSFSNNWDAMEYYVVLQTWLSGDVAAGPLYKGDLGQALGSIQALVYMMPGSTDQYFIAEEIEKEAKLIPRCVFMPLESPFGHVAEGRPECQPQINAAIAACLQEVSEKQKASL